MLNARALLTFPVAPSAAQIAHVRAVMDAQYVTDMRIMTLNEVAAAMTIDSDIRTARVQDAVDGAINTGTALVSALIACVAVYQVRGAALCRARVRRDRVPARPVHSDVELAQLAIALPLLRRTLSDVRTTRAMLMMLPPELMLRVPAIVRYLHEVTDKDSSGVRRRASDEEGPHSDAYAPETARVRGDGDRGDGSDAKDDIIAAIPLAGGARRVKMSVTSRVSDIAIATTPQ